MDLFQKLKDMKTLLIDDDQVIRHVLHTAFTSQGCLLKAVKTAEEGLRALENERFDIIISDLQLPDTNGVEFFKQAISAQPSAVNVLISGYGDDRAVAQAFEIGVHLFIKKPFSLISLLEQLIAHIEKCESRKTRHHDTAGTAKKLNSKEKPISSGHAEVQPGCRPKKTLDFIW